MTLDGLPIRHCIRLRPAKTNGWWRTEARPLEGHQASGRRSDGLRSVNPQASLFSRRMALPVVRGLTSINAVEGPRIPFHVGNTPFAS